MSNSFSSMEMGIDSDTGNSSLKRSREDMEYDYSHMSLDGRDPKRARVSSPASTRILSSTHGQTQSRLFTLPPELRVMIYKIAFDETRLTFGYREIRLQYREIVPDRNVLAILHVCRQMYEEASVLWLSRVLFNFEDNMTLMDKFSQLPVSTLGQIRHLRIRMVGNEPEPPPSIIDEDQWYGLQVLQGLNLDRLTVVPTWGAEYNGLEDICRFTSTSFPCKELCYFTPRSSFHQTNQSTAAEATTLLTNRITAMADDMESRGDSATPFTMTVFQSSQPDSERTGTVFEDSAIQVLPETAMSKNPEQSKMVAFGKALQPATETLVVFKPAATTSSLPDSSLTEVWKTVDDKQVRKTWRDDYRDAYVKEAEWQMDMENLTAGEMFPWPFVMRKGYMISDQYEDINDIIWPGKNAHQAWKGVLDN